LIGPSSVIEAAARELFGRPLITNVYRGVIAETIVDFALRGAGWKWSSIDYAAWDFEHAGGMRLEVKQSALLQSWSSEPSKLSSLTFDIRPRIGRYEGAAWISEEGRQASIYVFAFHFVADNSANHADPAQWEFYVRPTGELPERQKRISLSSLRRKTPAVRFTDLAASVEKLRVNAAPSK
jgi:hypothetical protein